MSEHSGVKDAATVTCGVFSSVELFSLFRFVLNHTRKLAGNSTSCFKVSFGKPVR